MLFELVHGETDPGVADELQRVGVPPWSAAVGLRARAARTSTSVGLSCRSWWRQDGRHRNGDVAERGCRE